MIRKLIFTGLYLAGVLILLFGQGVYATTDSKVAVPVNTLAQASATSLSCNYYFMDAYDGTVLPGGTGSDPAPAGTTVSLEFYNSVYNAGTGTSASNPTYMTPAMSCAGTYQISFTIEVQANTDVTSLTITPSVISSGGAIIYPTATSSPTFTLYPECNNPSYAGKPYCTVGTITGASIVTLHKGDQVIAPTFVASTAVTVVGGVFELQFLHQ